MLILYDYRAISAIITLLSVVKDWGRQNLLHCEFHASVNPVQAFLKKIRKENQTHGE